MKHAGRVAGLLLLAAQLVGCEELVNPRKEAMKELTESAIMPMLADLEDKTAELADQARELCDAPDAEALENARDAWSAARAPWKQSEVLSFGPHTKSPWSLAPQIDFWPVRVDDIDGVLTGDVALTGDDPLSEVGAPSRGFAAIEYLLFTSDDDAEAFANGDLAARRCDYLIAASEDLDASAGELHAAWRDEFGAAFSEQTGDEYANLDEAFRDLVNSLAFTVEVVRDDKLGRPLGRKTDGVPQPDLVESRFSGRSIEDSLDVLRGLENMFDGSYAGTQGKGLSFVLNERHRDHNAELAMHFETAMDGLRAIDGPLDEAIVEDPAAVEDAMDELQQLLVFFQVDIAQALGVTVTFGGADGD